MSACSSYGETVTHRHRSCQAQSLRRSPRFLVSTTAQDWQSLARKGKQSNNQIWSIQKRKTEKTKQSETPKKKKVKTNKKNDTSPAGFINETKSKVHDKEPRTKARHLAAANLIYDFVWMANSCWAPLAEQCLHLESHYPSDSCLSLKRSSAPSSASRLAPPPPWRGATVCPADLHHRCNTGRQPPALTTCAQLLAVPIQQPITQPDPHSQFQKKKNYLRVWRNVTSI